MAREDLFPIGSCANAADHLEIGGCDVSDLAREFGTPLYLLDERTLRTQAEQAQAALAARWPDTTVLFATKAYFAPFLARLYRELGLGIDVTSEGELEIARRTAFPPQRIYLHGNNKTPAEIAAAFALGVDHVVVDNRSEIPLIAHLAVEKNLRPRLLLRLSPNIDPHTHEYLTTGRADSKFGVGIADGEAERAHDDIRRYSNLRLVGFHLHIGSQIFELDAYAQAIQAALALTGEWKRRYGFELEELDVGGGWGVAYADEQESIDVETVAQGLTHSLRQGLAEHRLSDEVKLLVEPGRALIARAGVSLYRVGSIKRVSPTRTFAAVDGGMGDNIRPPLYGARYTARVANRFSDEAQKTYAVAGRYCEQGDILIDAVDLPELETGDLLALPASGAYQLPMASNYNLIPRPAVVLVSGGRARLVRRRETFAEMFSCDVDSFVE